MKHQRFYRYLPAFVIAAIALVEMATDMYLPNLPMVLEEFGTNEALLQITLSINLLGLATAGLVAGPLSDAIGRRKTLLCGLSFFLLGGTLCIMAPSVGLLIGARLLGGLGGGVVLVVGMASVRDCYQDARLSRIMSMMGMAIAVSPGIAPLIGGYIGAYLGWRYTFGFLAVSGLCLLVLAFYILPETLATQFRKPFLAISLFKNYLMLFKKRIFILNGLLLGLTIGQLWVEMGNLPFLFIQTYDVPSHYYGIYFGTNVFVFVLGTLFNQRYVMKYGVNRLLLTGMLLKTVSVLSILAAAWVDLTHPWLIQICFYPGAFGLALVIANASSSSLSSIDENVGSASAIIMLLEMLLAATALYVAGFFFNNTLWPMAISGVIWMGLVFGIYALLRRGDV